MLTRAGLKNGDDLETEMTWPSFISMRLICCFSMCLTRWNWFSFLNKTPCCLACNTIHEVHEQEWFIEWLNVMFLEKEIIYIHDSNIDEKYATHSQESVLRNALFGFRISNAITTNLIKLSAGYFRVEVIYLYHRACVGHTKILLKTEKLALNCIYIYAIYGHIYPTIYIAYILHIYIFYYIYIVESVFHQLKRPASERLGYLELCFWFASVAFPSSLWTSISGICS